MHRFRPTLRLRLTLLYGGLFLVTGSVLLAVNYGLVRKNLSDRLRPVAIQVGQGISTGDAIGTGDGTGPAIGPGPGPGAVFDQSLPAFGAQVFSGDPAEAEAALRRLEEGFRDRALHELVVQSSIALGILAVASVGLGWLVAGRALRPLAHVTATARRLSEDNLHERLALQGPADELKELGDTFDAMLARLESAFDGQRRFAANASHELRTPLAIQRTVVDVALADPDTSTEELRTMALAVRDAVERSERLIDGLLVLARSDRVLPEQEPCDLAGAASLALDQAAAEGAARDLRVETRLDPAPVTGDRVLLERLLGNLVQNAVRHNCDGGWLLVETGSSRDEAWVRVRNGGAIVAAEEVDSLFEPFRRAGPERTRSQRGVGLGLSIVRAVAVAHGGVARATAPPEGGLDVAVTLPARRL